MQDVTLILACKCVHEIKLCFGQETCVQGERCNCFVFCLRAGGQPPGGGWSQPGSRGGGHSGCAAQAPVQQPGLLRFLAPWGSPEVKLALCLKQERLCDVSGN